MVKTEYNKLVFLNMKSYNADGRHFYTNDIPAIFKYLHNKSMSQIYNQSDIYPWC